MRAKRRRPWKGLKMKAAAGPSPDVDNKPDEGGSPSEGVSEPGELLEITSDSDPVQVGTLDYPTPALPTRPNVINLLP